MRLPPLFSLLCLIAITLAAQAQTSRTMPQTGTTTQYTLCYGESGGYMLRNSSSSFYRGRTYNAAVTFHSNFDDAIRLTITAANICDSTSRLIIYDGRDTNAPVLIAIDRNSALSFPLQVTARSGNAYVRHHIASWSGECTRNTFQIEATDIGIDDIAATNVGEDFATLDWNDTTDNASWVIRYGTLRHTLSQTAYATTHPFQLTGLAENTQYYYQIYRQEGTAATTTCTAQTFTTTCYLEEGLMCDSVTASTATIDWTPSDGATQWVIRYGTSINSLDNEIYTRTRPFRLTGLDERTTYYYQVLRADRTVTVSNCPPATFTTECDLQLSGCINFADLTDCRVTCQYGYYGNPASRTGMVDNGETSSSSRHTVVHTRRVDTRATIAGGDTLWTIPDDEIASVRLGNWSTGSQAERITYNYYVDTQAYDLLIMKYAVVLQSPGHTRREQPLFEFAITDEEGETIDPICNAATFIPGFTSAEWKQGTGTGDTRVEWQDWTAIGLDLSPFHGTNIKITLTSKDCSKSGHYGYAYFVLKCSNRRIESKHCGASVDNTFQAPSGFSYVWFNQENPTDTLATSDTLHVTAIGVYGCRMGFHGQDATSSCEFTSYAVAGPRYPFARFDTLCTDTVNCQFRYQMTNQSVITEDPEHNELTPYGCEGYEWIVDDSLHYTTSNLTHDFTYGRHTVTLLAKLSGGLCTDSLTYVIDRPPVCRIYDTIVDTTCANRPYRLWDTVLNTSGTYSRDSGMYTTVVQLHVAPVGAYEETASPCDSLRWDDSTFRATTTYTRQLTTRRMGAEYDCDSLRTLRLTIRRSTTATLHDTCVENQLPRQIRNADGTLAHTIGDTQADTLLHMTNAAQCDSILTYSLHVWHNTVATDSLTLCENSLPITWNGETFATHADDTRTATLSGMHGEDSVVEMHLTVLRNTLYEQHDTVVENDLPIDFAGLKYEGNQADTLITRENAAGCDSLITYSLTVWDNLKKRADSTLCENLLPLTWNGITFYDDGVDSVMMPAKHGEDSLLTMYVHVLRNTVATIHDTAVENDLPVGFAGLRIGGNIADTTIIRVNAAGCDSIIHYSLHVWRNRYTNYDTAVCEHELPLEWDPFTFERAESKQTTLSAGGMHGEDSTVRKTLSTYPDYKISVIDTVSDLDLPYTYLGRKYRNTFYNDTFHLHSIHQCDSIVSLSVVVDYHAVSCERYLAFPNLVTPNGDGIDDRFEIKGLIDNDCYPHNELHIYDRWGRKIFAAKNIKRRDDFWDPSPSNVLAGTYFYVFTGRGAQGAVKRSGTIEVVK